MIYIYESHYKNIEKNYDKMVKYYNAILIRHSKNVDENDDIKQFLIVELVHQELYKYYQSNEKYLELLKLCLYVLHNIMILNFSQWMKRKMDQYLILNIDTFKFLLIKYNDLYPNDKIILEYLAKLE